MLPASLKASRNSALSSCFISTILFIIASMVRCPRWFYAVTLIESFFHVDLSKLLTIWDLCQVILRCCSYIQMCANLTGIDFSKSIWTYLTILVNLLYQTCSVIYTYIEREFAWAFSSEFSCYIRELFKFWLTVAEPLGVVIVVPLRWPSRS